MPIPPKTTWRKIAAPVLACLFLNACAAPPALQILSLVADGVSYIATDKTIADHGLSAITQKDCKMIRTLKGEDICEQEQEEDIVEQAIIDPEEPLVQEPQ
jgi:hypothetical protein